MNILSIDTALHTCGIGVVRDGKVVFNQSQSMPRGQDQALAIAVQDALKQSKCSMAELSAIAITTGPGSFTGIRVGMAFARGLVSVLNIPLIGLTTADVLAHQAGGTATVVIEIKKDAYIVQNFDNGQSKNELKSLDTQGLQNFISNHDVQLVVTHSLNVQALLGIECQILTPEPASMLTLAEQRYKGDVQSNKIVRPVYIRQADVTVKN